MKAVLFGFLFATSAAATDIEILKGDGTKTRSVFLDQALVVKFKPIAKQLLQQRAKYDASRKLFLEALEIALVEPTFESLRKHERFEAFLANIILDLSKARIPFVKIDPIKRKKLSNLAMDVQDASHDKYDLRRELWAALDVSRLTQRMRDNGWATSKDNMDSLFLQFVEALAS